MVTITDPILEPFYITHNKNGYTLIEKVTSSGRHHKSKNVKKENDKVIGYYSSLGPAFYSLSKEKLIKN